MKQVKYFKILLEGGEFSIRGLRVQHFCYPTRSRTSGLLPVPIHDPYSNCCPYPYPTRTQNYYPTRIRGYTRTCHCQTFLCIVYVPTRLIVWHVGSSCSLIG